MEERFRMVQDLDRGYTVSEVSRLYGVTRTTVSVWRDRYRAEGLEGLRDRSRAPLNHPNQIGEEIEELVLAERRLHPSWGAPKIRARLESEHPEIVAPAVSTIGELLKRHGLTVNRKRRLRSRPTPGPLETAAGPNQVWSADFKGWFRTRDGRRIDPLTISDNYSRYLLRCQCLKAATGECCKPVFEAAFREFGLPQRLRTDNGAPFGSNGESGLTALTVWWIKLGIRPERIAPGKRQQNGRHERMHRTLKQETAAPPAANRRRQQERFDRFREEYNEVRPHQALEQQTPGSWYEASPRAYPERVAEPEYARGWGVRRVSAAGQIRWRGGVAFVSHALAGERLGLEQIGERCWRVWFSFYEIGWFDEQDPRMRRPPRIEPADEEDD